MILERKRINIMRYVAPLCLVLCFGLSTPRLHAYVEAPHTLGRCVAESTTIVLMEVAKVNKERGLVIFKKVRDIKGKHPADEIKHNVGGRGFHPREHQNILNWAEPGKKAVFMYNNEASETCIGTYWYQCYREGEWWGMTHAEPFLLRTFYGDAEKLAELCERILKNEEVIVTCLADGNKEQLHQRKGKVQRLRASLKRIDYNERRDFVALGADGEVDEFKTVEFLAASAKDWKFRPAADIANAANQWMQPDHDDANWSMGKAPIGYGEEELTKREGTTIEKTGVDFVFRKSFDVPAEILMQKNVTFRLGVASDDGAKVYLNGKEVANDYEAEHEFTYFNTDIEIPATALKAGRNVLALHVRNKEGSSDLFLDAEVTAMVPIPKKPKPMVVANPMPMNPSAPMTGTNQPASNFVDGWNPKAMTVDKANKRIALQCRVAPRKLPNLDMEYPIEVIATYPAPRAQKAHETVVTFSGFRPSDVQRAISDMGLTPGKPAIGENAQAEGPQVKVWFEIIKDGQTVMLPVEQLLVHRASGEPLAPNTLKWFFTGSAMKQPDPEQDDTIHGADMTGTLMALFPVTDATVLQTQWTMKDEPNFKLNTNAKVLPPVGTPMRLIIQLP